MKSFQLHIDHELQLLVIPDSVAHLDGHEILTYSYSLFRDSFIPEEKESNLHLTKNDDPDFYGTIIFEAPEKLFSYEPGIHNRLNPDEVEETIEKITHYRNTPSLWNL